MERQCTHQKQQQKNYFDFYNIWQTQILSVYAIEWIKKRDNRKMRQTFAQSVDEKRLLLMEKTWICVFIARVKKYGIIFHIFSTC